MKKLTALLTLILFWCFSHDAGAVQTYADLPTTTPPGLTGLALVTGINANTDTLLSSSSGTSAPSGPVTGQLWYNTTTPSLEIYNGSAFVAVSSGGGSGTVSLGSSANVPYYASTGTTVIGTTTMNIIAASNAVGIGTATNRNVTARLDVYGPVTLGTAAADQMVLYPDGGVSLGTTQDLGSGKLNVGNNFYVNGTVVGGSQVYPGAGVAVSTGTAWGTSLSTSGTGTVLCLNTACVQNLSLGTNLPISTGVSGLASGAATFLGTPTSANARAMMTDETGSGAMVFAGGALGAASATSMGIGTTTALALLDVNGGAMLATPSVLTIATATFTPVAVASNTYRVVLVHASCPCTIANPSGTAVDGQKFILEVWQSATGGDTVGTWGTNYDFGTTGSPTLSTAANKGDLIGFTYSAQNSKYNFIGITQGM